MRAVIFDTDLPFIPEGEPPSPVHASARLAGLSLMRRAIFLAWRAGADRAVIVAADAPAREAWAASEVGLPIPVAVQLAAEALPPAGDETLILSALVLPTPDLLKRLVSDFAAEGRGVRVQAEGDPASGPAIVSGIASTGAALDAVRAGLAGCATTGAGGDAYRRLDSIAAVAVADRAMYIGLTSASDGYIDRVFNRRISGWFTRRIINLPITPNQVTLFHFTLGMIGVALFWSGGYWHGVLGAVLLQLSVALDCSDGEVARLKYQFSKLGGWLDVWADNIVHIALFAAVAHAATTRMGAHTALTLGGLAVAGVVMCMAVIFGMGRLQNARRPGQASALNATNRLSDDQQGKSEEKPSAVATVINEATSRDFTVIVVACALFGRLDWMVWLSGIGSHVFWIAFAAIQLSLFRHSEAASR